MKKLVSTETKLEKENASHATPFGNQLDCPQKINYVHRQSQIRVSPCLSLTSLSHVARSQQALSRGTSVVDTWGTAGALPTSVF